MWLFLKLAILGAGLSMGLLILQRLLLEVVLNLLVSLRLPPFVDRSVCGL